MAWSQVALLKDEVVLSLVIYGFALNIQLEAWLVLPFMIYRVFCKSQKDLEKQDQTHGQIVNENMVNIARLMSIMMQFQVVMSSLFIAYMIPFMPYFFS